MEESLRKFAILNQAGVPDQFSNPKNRIGAGGEGEVYKIQANGRNLAVKVLKVNESDRPECHKVLKIAERINHPNFISYFGCDIDEVTTRTGKSYDYCLVMELAETSLESFLVTAEGINYFKSWDNASTFISKFFKGMAYLKSIKIAHRDIKPDNILLMQNKTPKLCDTGFAREQKGTLTKVSKMIGTKPYMAPEVAKGIKDDYENQNLCKCDTYSVAITLLRICGNSKDQIEGINGVDAGLSLKERETKLIQCLERIKNNYQGRNLDNFFNLLKMMFTEELLFRPDMQDIYTTCVKNDRLTFEHLEKLINLHSKEAKPETMYEMVLLYSNIDNFDDSVSITNKVQYWLKKTSDAGYQANKEESIDATFMLGWMNQYGIFPEVEDKEKAKKSALEYYEKAKAKGDKEAEEAIKNIDKPLELNNLSAEVQLKYAQNGDENGEKAEHQFMMAWRYHYGVGVQRNLQEAKKFYLEYLKTDKEDKEAIDGLQKVNSVLQSQIVN